MVRSDAGWTPARLRPYLGRVCAVRLACTACKREHVRRGRLAPSQRPGEVLLGGISYDVREILAITSEAEAPSTHPALHQTIALLGLLAGYVSWLRFVHS